MSTCRLSHLYCSPLETERTGTPPNNHQAPAKIIKAPGDW